MSVTFRRAGRADVPAVVRLLQDGALEPLPKSDDLEPFLEAFDAMQAAGINTLVVGETNGNVVATYQIAVISGLSLMSPRRAQLESVRVAGHLRGQGVGSAMMADAESRARAAGCTLIQLTTNSTRLRARAFYNRLGFTASHIGFKRNLT